MPLHIKKLHVVIKDLKLLSVNYCKQNPATSIRLSHCHLGVFLLSLHLLNGHPKFIYHYLIHVVWICLGKGDPRYKSKMENLGS